MKSNEDNFENINIHFSVDPKYFDNTFLTIVSTEGKIAENCKESMKSEMKTENDTTIGELISLMDMDSSEIPDFEKSNENENERNSEESKENLNEKSSVITLISDKTLNFDEQGIIEKKEPYIETSEIPSLQTGSEATQTNQTDNILLDFEYCTQSETNMNLVNLDFDGIIDVPALEKLLFNDN